MHVHESTLLANRAKHALTDNLAKLAELTEPIMLQVLAERFSDDMIYTYVADILVAVNPLKPVSLPAHGS